MRIEILENEVEPAGPVGSGRRGPGIHGASNYQTGPADPSSPADLVAPSEDVSASSSNSVGSYGRTAV
jgi:hypothetical protein